MADWDIKQGDALTVLRTMPAESVQCVVTSPPYWSLRDYNLEPLIWGGVPECAHAWGELFISKANDSNRGSMTWETGGNPAARVLGARVSQGSFCQLCNAWRGSLGLEPTPELYVSHLVEIFREVRRVLHKSGVLFLNLGDSYAGGGHGGGGSYEPERRAYSIIKGKRMPRGSGRWGGGDCSVPDLQPKQLVGIPWRVAFALQADGWWLRSDIIWHKLNVMPESVRDRPTKAHEYIFLLTKSGRYFYDQDAVREPHTDNSVARYFRGSSYDGDPGKKGPSGHGIQKWDKDGAVMVNPAGRNLRSVWGLATEPFSGWLETVHRVDVAPDAADDDTKRITSPDCPVHGDSLGQASSGGHDVREDDSMNHNVCIDNGRELKLDADSFPIEQPPENCLVADTSDLPHHEYSPAATDHNSGSYKTDPAPETNPSCTLSAGILSDKNDKSELRALSDQQNYMTENNTLIGASDVHQEPYTRDDSSDRFSKPREHGPCTCSYYKEVTKSISHFATFPTALAETCIKAGSSEVGCCQKCGSPWQRIVERQADSMNIRVRDAKKGILASKSGFDGRYRATEQEIAAYGDEKPGQSTTIGWQSTCKCQELYCEKCCTVLDYPHHRGGLTHEQDRRTSEVRDATHLRRMQERLSEPSQGRQDFSVVQPGVCGTMDGTSAAADRSEEIRQPNQGQERLYLDLESNTPPCQQGRLHHGTSPGDGEGARSAAQAKRDCPSSERKEGRQSSGEPRSDAQARPRPDTQATTKARRKTMSSLSPDSLHLGTCKACGYPLVTRTPAPVPQVVLDIFVGSGTTGMVALRLGRRFIGIDASPAYCAMARRRIIGDAPLFNELGAV